MTSTVPIIESVPQIDQTDRASGVDGQPSVRRQAQREQAQREQRREAAHEGRELAVRDHAGRSGAVVCATRTLAISRTTFLCSRGAETRVPVPRSEMPEIRPKRLIFSSVRSARHEIGTARAAK